MCRRWRYEVGPFLVRLADSAGMISGYRARMAGFEEGWGVESVRAPEQPYDSWEIMSGCDVQRFRHGARQERHAYRRRHARRRVSTPDAR